MTRKKEERLFLDSQRWMKRVTETGASVVQHQIKALGLWQPEILGNIEVRNP